MSPRIAFVIMLSLASGCGLPPTDHLASPGAPEGTTRSRLNICRVQDPVAPETLAASSEGVVFGVPATTTEGEQLTLQRYRGTECDLTPVGAPLAVSTILDFDDLGNIYAFPAEAPEPGVISTMLPGERANSMVAKIDATGRVTKLLDAGRGIWDFGVSPEGGTLWMTSCGPNGVYSVPADAVSTLSVGMNAVMDPPASRWEQGEAVLTDDRTFWSVGHSSCDYEGEVSPACGRALVRSTALESVAFGTTVVDFGQGYEAASLRRCGAYVCGVYPGGIVIWDDQGQVLATISLSDLEAEPEESIEQVSGNRLGVYVLLRGAERTRVVYAPTPAGS